MPPAPGPINHGTESGYRRGCRCEDCRQAARTARRRRRHDGVVRTERDDGRDWMLGDLLAELFPDGLTDECPARRAA